MKLRKRDMLGFVTALALSVGFGEARAQEVQRPGLLIVVGKATDRAKMGSYAAALPQIYAKNGGYYLAIGATGRGVRWLEGTWADRSLVLAKFPSRAAVDAFWWGDDYRAAIAKRDNAGAFSVSAHEALQPLLLEGPDVGYLIIMTASAGQTEAQKKRAARAAFSLQQSVLGSGGTLLTSTDSMTFTMLEGDTVFDRISIAAWPSKAARDGYLNSASGKASARLRQRAGFNAVAAIDSVLRTPTGASPSPQHIQAPQ